MVQFFSSDRQCCCCSFFFLNLSRFPILLQFYIKAECAAHHRHGL